MEEEMSFFFLQLYLQRLEQKVLHNKALGVNCRTLHLVYFTIINSNFADIIWRKAWNYPAFLLPETNDLLPADACSCVMWWKGRLFTILSSCSIFTPHCFEFSVQQNANFTHSTQNKSTVFRWVEKVTFSSYSKLEPKRDFRVEFQRFREENSTFCRCWYFN